MSEGEVVEQLVGFTNTLLAGVSLIFSVVSAYVVALNYFIGSSNLMARLGSFMFVTLILGMLLVVLMGAAGTHAGLIMRLVELEAAGQLTTAGRAVLENAQAELAAGLSIDAVVRMCVWIGLAFVYFALGYLTFLHKWQPDAIPITIENRGEI
jgi:hypothetical protein